jgi:membrane associated rhomboid family serine protease|tara:strand:+ start:38 stop:658 length:621 start_codon:yes stop_codon:yes gene_type:complete
LVVFFFQISSSQSNLITYYFGFKPASFFNNFDKPTFFPVLTLFTSLFMHGGWMHLIGNMMYLVIFADNIEDVFGKKKFILFYLFSGIFASFSQALLNLSSDVPMIGASGAIAGVLGAYLFYFPKAKILVLVPFFIFFTLRIPASILLIFWFIFQFLNLSNIESSVAWMAHIGGFIFGYIFSIINGKKPIQKKGSSIFLNKKKGPWD